MREEDDRKQQIVGAAIEVRLKFGCPDSWTGSIASLCDLCVLCGKKET